MPVSSYHTKHIITAGGRSVEFATFSYVTHIAIAVLRSVDGVFITCVTRRQQRFWGRSGRDLFQITIRVFRDDGLP